MPKKRLLIITYYWPPAGGVVTYRLLKFIKFLPPLGWDITVYVPKDAPYETEDHSLLDQVPDGVTVLRQPIVEPLSWLRRRLGSKSSGDTTVDAQSSQKSVLKKLALWVRGNLFIPDARALWIRPSVKFLVNYLRQHPVDVLFSTAPPHTTTVVADRVKRRTGIPWVADFRDPWTQADYFQWFPFTRWALRRHQRLERSALQNANVVVNVSPTWQQDLKQLSDHTGTVIYSGYDADDVADLPRTPTDRFVITHAGLLGYDRLPEGLFQALQNITNDTPTFADKLTLQLVGPVDGRVVDLAGQYGLAPHLTLTGTVSRQETLRRLVNSTIVLVLLNHAENARGRVPGKLFEGLASGNTILCLGPTDSDAAAIVRQAQAGQCFDYHQADRIEASIRRWFSLFLTDTLTVPPPDPFYSAAHQTSLLDQWLRKQAPA